MLSAGFGKGFLLVGLAGWFSMTAIAGEAGPFGGEATVALAAKMTAKFGEEHRPRIEAGVRQARALWKAEDGTDAEFETFCLERFIADRDTLNRTFARIQDNLESILGNFLRISRDLKTPIELDRGEPLAVDYVFAEWSPYAHLETDFFRNKLAFAIVLNFPQYTLEQKLALGEKWDRRQWAMARLGDRFTSRIPAEVNQVVNERSVKADNYISEYNIFMGRLLGPDGKTLFPPDLKLISHWGIRDELKSWYGKADGAARQETIYQVMLRIIDQSIPARVVNRSDAYWDPKANQVYEERDGRRVPVDAAPEGGKRYEMLLSMFGGQRLKDPHVPLNPTLIARRFNEDRQIPEEQVEKLFTGLLSSPLIARTAALIEKRLGRKLRPYDIWYDGFKTRSTLDTADLDARLRAKYPDVKAFQADLVPTLVKLGFSAERARFLADRIVVDPSRGAGHAMGAEMRADQVRLRTRIPAGGMNYKGYNIAAHELGHNVEQVFSLHAMDEYLLSGVPNTGFTEAFAFVFQKRDLELLGIPAADPMKKDLEVLDDLWMTYEIAGVSLVDMKVWRWLYAHPDATAAQLQAAVADIAREVWNVHYAPVFGEKDCTILAIYSHMIDALLYLPDYALGHLIAFQIEKHLEGKNLGEEMERMCRMGSVTPRLWMLRAVGSDLSAEPLLASAREALGRLESAPGSTR